jgi:hypothetical protein
VSEPLSVSKLGVVSEPVFVRKITRRNNWETPLLENDPDSGAAIFLDEESSTSLWRVQTDVEFRRVALAMNEGRCSLREELFLLPIKQEHFESLTPQPFSWPGVTDCAVAKQLHYEIKLDQSQRVALAKVLIDANRKSVKCTRGEMAAATVLSTDEGCLTAVDTPIECLACGAVRS